MKYLFRFLTVVGVLLAAATFDVRSEELSADKRPDPVPLTQLKAGVAKVDITPSIQIPLSGYSPGRDGPATGIHDPLHATVIVFDDGRKRSSLVTLDILQITQQEGNAMKAAIEAAAGIPPDHVVINVSHTHGSPVLRNDASWHDEVIAKVAGAVRLAASRLRPVSLGYGEGVIDFNINRRVITSDGKCIAGLNPDGICDHRVKVIRVDDSDSIAPLAVLIHVVCHANVYRAKNTEITADFPGIAKSFVERSFGGRTTAFFLQGCSGDIRANLPTPGNKDAMNTGDFGRSANEVDATWAGWSLGAEVVKVATRLRVREQVAERPSTFDIAAAADMLRVTVDGERVKSFEQYDNKVREGKVDVPIRAMRIGRFWFVGLPGEPVVEYGLQIEEAMKGLGDVMVLGYTSGDAGYIPVAHMIKEGGYEVESSPFSEQSEQEILDGVRRLIARLQ